MKSIKINKLGIAISTYSENKTNPYRYKIIEKSFLSLAQTIKNKPEYLDIKVLLVVDGRVPDRHLELINKFENTFDIIHRKDNGGVSKVKNTGIKSLLERDVDVGVLVDDDVFFHDGWINVYTKLIEDLQLHHFTWNDRRIFENLKITKPSSGALKSFSYVQKKGYDLFKHPGTCGIFLTFTPELIEKIGYFKVMPGKIGNEHQHFTIRANRSGMIGPPVDLINSYEFIEHIGVLDAELDINDQAIIHSVSDEFREKENKNSGFNMTDTDRYFSCIE